MDISTTCCICGHRPKALPWGYDELDVEYKKTREQLIKEIYQAIESGYTNFISGMALGIDLLAAKLILDIKKISPNITLTCAIPCHNQDRMWRPDQRATYNDILEKADNVVFIYDGNYFPGCMHMRNNYMINSSSRMIAVYNGKNTGGTFNTIVQAQKNNVDIHLIKI